jgi:hypothetical protein
VVRRDGVVPHEIDVAVGRPPKLASYVYLRLFISVAGEDALAALPLEGEPDSADPAERIDEMERGDFTRCCHIAL